MRFREAGYQFAGGILVTRQDELNQKHQAVQAATSIRSEHEEETIATNPF